MGLWSDWVFLILHPLEKKQKGKKRERKKEKSSKNFSYHTVFTK